MMSTEATAPQIGFPKRKVSSANPRYCALLVIAALVVLVCAMQLKEIQPALNAIILADTDHNSDNNAVADDERISFEEDAIVSGENRRRFVKYTSSQWERLWLSNIDQWEKEMSICENILSPEQANFLNIFQKVICTHHFQKLPWCAVDDPVAENKYFYNNETRQYVASLPEVSWEVLTYIPPRLVEPGEAEDDGSDIPYVFSRFDFVDEITGESYTEYIEPLVSHLRHPAAVCVADWFLVTSRSFVVPPPLHSAKVFPRAFYFDGGASAWSQGAGGPSLSYFTEIWKRHGIDFDLIEGWEGTVSPEDFYNTVPLEYYNKTLYHQEWISSSPDGDPFIPFVIQNRTRKEDYVFFKLDIDNGLVEKGTVDYLLSEVDDSLQYVDEFVWEHHAGGNYLMGVHWGSSVDNLTISDSYMYFLRLRMKGVRAHSWV